MARKKTLLHIFGGMTAQEIGEELDRRFKHSSSVNHYNYFITDYGLMICKSFFKEKEHTERSMTIEAVTSGRTLKSGNRWKTIAALEKISFSRGCIYAEKRYLVFINTLGQAFVLDLKDGSCKKNEGGSALGKQPETIAYDATEDEFVLTFKDINGGKSATLTRKIKYPKK